MIHDDETLVREMLTRAADDLPTGSPDTTALVTAGERAVRRRRRLAVAATAVVTAVALLGVTALLGVRQPPTPADRTWPPTVAPTAFDPARQLFRLTWLPEELPERSLSTAADRQTIGAARYTPFEGTQARRLVGSVAVTVGARGVDFFTDQLTRDNRNAGKLRSGPTPWPTPPGSPVEPVQGHPAFLHTSPDGKETVLSWRYAADAWVTITAVTLDRPAEVLRRVAEGMVWERQPVRVPFQPVALPSDARLQLARMGWRDGRWDLVLLDYRLPGSSAAGGDLTIGLERSDQRSDPTGVVQGRPAWISVWRGWSGTWSVGGVPGCVGCRALVGTGSPAGSAALGGQDGARDLAAAIRPVATHDDESTWRPL
ncbi:hypothetical protein B5D80_03040 [Micromonospora wenchangensis]|uniref:Uncharacterized protein n=1 Tax=Micromonospora wenchangensis TaxID=1185415 RepID=A0A246RSS5_9ACTN|nr:hypothetical protein [Micromonospora wenchangensis]OWV12446.1 hypothetical protein B5D80_03040 [Micromonospora wenchangensis]